MIDNIDIDSRFQKTRLHMLIMTNETCEYWKEKEDVIIITICWKKFNGFEHRQRVYVIDVSTKKKREKRTCRFSPSFFFFSRMHFKSLLISIQTTCTMLLYKRTSLIMRVNITIWFLVFDYKISLVKLLFIQKNILNFICYNQYFFSLSKENKGVCVFVMTFNYIHFPFFL
jgi:hypothetical protein